MALIIDPKYIGCKVKVQGYGSLIEVCEKNKQLLLNHGQTQFFKHKKDASNNEKPTKPTVHKRKRKSNVDKS